MLVREHVEHALDRERIRGIDALMRPLAMAEVTTTPCARPGTLYSAAYFAAPVTFARPSMREVGLPNGWWRS